MRTVKSDHQRAQEALQAAQRRHDKARAKYSALDKAAVEAKVEVHRSERALHYAEQHPALADEDTAGDGGEMAAT